MGQRSVGVSPTDDYTFERAKSQLACPSLPISRALCGHNRLTLCADWQEQSRTRPPTAADARPIPIHEASANALSTYGRETPEGHYCGYCVARLTAS
jgi:hypothetical protein